MTLSRGTGDMKPPVPPQSPPRQKHGPLQWELPKQAGEDPLPDVPTDRRSPEDTGSVWPVRTGPCYPVRTACPGTAPEKGPCSQRGPWPPQPALGDGGVSPSQTPLPMAAKARLPPPPWPQALYPLLTARPKAQVLALPSLACLGSPSPHLVHPSSLQGLMGP